MPNFNEFKAKIDSIDNEFLSYMLNLEGIKSDEDGEIERAKKDALAHSSKTYAKLTEMLRSYSTSVMGLIDKIERSGVKLGKCADDRAFSSYSEALNFLNENSDAIKNAVSAINSYKFEKSKFNYKFDGETATIDGKNYTAPDFPTVSLDDFDTDTQHIALASELYALCLAQASCLKYLTNVVNSNAYKLDLQKKVEAVNQSATEIIKDENSDKINALKAQIQQKYNTDFSKFLKGNERVLNDYQTMSSLNIPEIFERRIVIGSLPYKFTNISKYEAQMADIDKDGLISDCVKYPVSLNLEENGNVLLNTDTNDNRVVEFVHQLIMQYISSAPYKKVNLALVDLDNSEYDFVFNYSKEYLKKNNLLFSGNVITEEDQLKDLVVALNRKLIDIKGNKLSFKSCDNIFEYNELSRENSQEIHLLVIVDYPKHADSAIAEKLSNLIKNGNKCGIFTILVNNTSIRVPNDSYGYNASAHTAFIEQCKKFSLTVDYSSENNLFTTNDIEFAPNEAFSSKSINQFFKSLEEGSSQASKSQIIYLDSIMGIDYTKKPYYEQIKIPVGKDGGDSVFFSLDVDGTGTSSALVAGGTGSGKSAFLHTIILSGAYNYSPEELEYYLIDFKDGVEFSPYSDKENGINIPHVSFLSLKNKVEDAYDILMKIYAEKNRRNELFKRVNASDIKSYHNSSAVKSGKYPNLKRMVVIIDEYQNFLTSTDTNTAILCNKCAGLLLSLLKEIRSVGISIVLSSQSVSVEREALDQIYNRYIFSSSANVLQTAFPEFSGDEMNNELNKEKGLVYMTSNGGVAKKLFKAAFSGKTNEREQKAVAKQINEKWSGIKGSSLTISGSDERLPIYASDAPFVKFDDIELSEDNIIKSYVGQGAMSSEPMAIEFKDSDACSYLILGEIKKTRGVEASIGLSFLYALKKYGFDITSNNLHYIDLNNSNVAIRNPSPFDTYRDKLNEVMTYAVENDEVISSIDSVYEEYLSRKEASKSRSREIKAPILMIVNSFSCLDEISVETRDGGATGDLDMDDMLASLSGGLDFGSSSSSQPLTLAEKIKTIYQNGHTYNMFVVIQERHASEFGGYDSFVNLSRVICCDKNELENCKMSENGGSVTITDLPENYAVLFPNVSKIRPFEFDKSSEEGQYIDKLVEELLK